MSRVNEFLKQAKAGKSVFITTVRNAFSSMNDGDSTVMYCFLDTLDADKKRIFDLRVPSLKNVQAEEVEFVKTYIHAEVFNILSSLGGRTLTMYVDRDDESLYSIVSGLSDVLDIQKDKASRSGFGRCINVIDRMLGAIVGEDVRFSIVVNDITTLPKSTEQVTPKATYDGIFKKVAENLEGKMICGVDIGGTDVKVAMAIDGKLECLKEYDWNPMCFPIAEMIIDPIVLLPRLTRAKVSLDESTALAPAKKAELQGEIAKAMDRTAEYDQMQKIVELVEKELGGNIRKYDAIGLCFPDVVIKDKIVGGETTKTKGMRENASINYETEFSKLTKLDEMLLQLCKPGGVVKDTNDGPMASFTAGVEMAASADADLVKNGVFAHTLGTELGTGWADSAGVIPEIPLEFYNCIIDLGHFVAKRYPAEDVRSINNINTGLTGTLQRYTSQGGIFRLAIETFPEQRPDLYKEIFDKGFVCEKEVDGEKMLYVPTEPKDMRKSFLEHLMSLPQRENDEVTKNIFRQVGVYLAITWFETQRIVAPTSENRILFGRIVKNDTCFKLICEGARSVKRDIQFTVADADMANTKLMKQLAADSCFTVAQFAQAIGSIYYGNMGL